MIIRRTILRQVRRLSATPAKPWSRCFASEITTLEAAVENSLKETHSIESLIQRETPKAIPRVDDATHRTLSFKSDETVRRHIALQHHRETTGGYGTELAPHYQPHTLLTNPPRPSDITLELLLASQSHLGHSTSLWNPMNSRYIFGIRQGIHIISLDVTASHLRRACRVVSGVAERGGLILFVGTRAGQDRCVVKAAELAGGCHLFERWIPGSITNGQQILGSCRKKVVDENDKDVDGYEEELSDAAALKPDLVVCLNPLENWVMLHECGLNHIPTIGIIDTDADPTWVTYPIPANDDSLRCVQVVAGVLGRAGEEGRMRRLAKARKGEITYTPSRFNTGVEEDDDDDLNEDWDDALDEEDLGITEQSDGVVDGKDLDVEGLDVEGLGVEGLDGKDVDWLSEKEVEGLRKKDLEGLSDTGLEGLGENDLDGLGPEALEESGLDLDALDADDLRDLEEAIFDDKEDAK